MYCNKIYWGHGAYGVEAAALNYFGVHASKLTLPQAALLAGMVRNPVGTNPRTSGLALVAKLVDEHGGMIDVSSVPRRTEIRVRLPKEPYPEGTHP